MADSNYARLQAEVLAAMKDQENAERMTLVDDKGRPVELQYANGLWTTVEDDDEEAT